jgi:hypothetical protein
MRISSTLQLDHRVQVDCESLLDVGCDSLLVSGSDHSPCQHDPRRRSQHRGHVRLSPSAAHIDAPSSVAVLLNLDGG